MRSGSFSRRHSGQTSLIIPRLASSVLPRAHGRRRWRCGGFGVFRAGWFLARRGGHRGRIFFRSFLVGITAVVGDIKSRAFKDQSGAGPDEPLHFSMSPFFLPAKLLRTFAQGFIAHRLAELESATALLAGVFISRHGALEGGERSQFSLRKSRIQAIAEGRPSAASLLLLVVRHLDF